MQIHVIYQLKSLEKFVSHTIPLLQFCRQTRLKITMHEF